MLSNAPAVSLVGLAPAKAIERVVVVCIGLHCVVIGAAVSSKAGHPNIVNASRRSIFNAR